MRVFVTGATGFVGQAIVSQLSENKIEVVSLGSLESENKDNLPDFLRGDVRNYGSLKYLENLKNIDTVIHSAGLAHQFGRTRDEDFDKVNVDGTRIIAQIAVNLNVKHFVLISSVSVYGIEKDAPDTRFVTEDFVCSPKGAYERSKFESELVAREICEKNRIGLTILRLATVIGEKDRGNTARLIRAIDKKRFFWIGDGENLKSLVYKADAAKACLSILRKKSAKTEVFNITAEPIKMQEIVSEIASTLNKKIPRLKISPSLFDKIFAADSKIFRSKRLLKLSETVEKWLSSDIFSGDKISEEYGFRTETQVSEAIRRQVEFYKRQK